MGEMSEKSPDRTKNKSVLYWIAAALLFTGLLLAGIFFPEEQKNQSPDLVIFGDSIFARMQQEELSVGDRLQEKSGLTILNGAFGGTCLARQNTQNTMDFSQDILSMAVLARAVASEDFLAQQSVKMAEPATWYFEGTVDEIGTVDFDDVGIFFLDFGMNDYHCGIPVDDEENPFNETTYAGALRTVLSLLRKRYPETRILLATPTYSWYPDRGFTCEEYSFGGGVLEDYVEKELEVAREYGVEILDFYHDFYPHEKMEDWKLYTWDGIHPNDAGREKIASAIADYLEENP